MVNRASIRGYNPPGGSCSDTATINSGGGDVDLGDWAKVTPRTARRNTSTSRAERPPGFCGPLRGGRFEIALTGGTGARPGWHAHRARPERRGGAVRPLRRREGKGHGRRARWSSRKLLRETKQRSLKRSPGNADQQTEHRRRIEFERRGELVSRQVDRVQIADAHVGFDEGRTVRCDAAEEAVV
jgi:hypothetical protein